MMWTVLGLCALLVLESLRGATSSQVQIYGKSVYAGHVLGSGHDGRPTARGQLHQARRTRKNSHHRSLDLEAFNIHVAPTASEINLPTIIRLYPPTAKPMHLSGNMPLRFGRDGSPSSNNNLPLRFGRDAGMPLRFGRDAGMPLRFGRNGSPSSNNNLPLRYGRDAGMPLRFGRDSEAERGDDTARVFGHSGRRVPGCLRCSDAERQLQGLYWSLLRTIHTY